MAEQEQDRTRDDLSEEASPYKVEELRKKGQVAQSKELSGLLALLATGIAIYMLSPQMSEQIGNLMKDFFNADLSSRLDLGDHDILLSKLFVTLTVLGKIISPICIVAMIIAVLGSYVQIGSIFTTEPMTPDLNRINPINGAKKFFSLKIVYDGLRLVFRGVCVCAIAYFLIKSEIYKSPGLIFSNPQGLIDSCGSAARIIFSVIAFVLLVFAGIDYWLQRLEYSKQTHLTKKEQKEEHKEREGDPLIKARIRSVQREMARRRMMDAVKKADVVITNPTHIAVALLYDKENMDSPKVIAKGADFLAQKIKKIAAEAGVPMVENRPLARTLYKTVKIGQLIPRALYQSVAEILAYVYQLKGKRF